PPSLDILVQQKFLRKKYKDPITNDDFVPIAQSASTGAQRPAIVPLQPGGAPQTTQPGRGQPAGGVGTSAPGGAPVGGITGVTTQSPEPSIRLYKGRSHYNEWAFIYPPPATAGGGGAPGAARPGGRGQRGGQQPGPAGRANTGNGTFQPGPFPTGPSSPIRP